MSADSLSRRSMPLRRSTCCSTTPGWGLVRDAGTPPFWIGNGPWVVNLWGVIHGVRVFVPIMLQQETECHIVNTASIAGFISYHPTCASYHVSKHAVVALSEQLHYDLREEEARIGVSVLCPGGVRTRIGESRRNRPESLTDDTAPTKPRPENESIRNLRQVVAEGMLPDDVGEKVFAAIRENRFYILTHPEYKTMIRTRMEDILAERNPTNPTFFVA